MTLNPEIIAKCAPELNGLIPEPHLASKNLPDWLREMPTTVEKPGSKETLMTMKRCLPSTDAISGGILIPLVCDIEVTDEGWRWDWTPKLERFYTRFRGPVSSHPGYQAKGSPLELPEGKAFVIFVNWWMIEMPKGWGMFFTHPVNRIDLPFQTIPGLVDLHAFRDFPVNFPARWIDPDFRGTLKAGTPIAQGFPVPIGVPQLDVREATLEEMERERKFASNNMTAAYRDARRKARKKEEVDGK